MTLRLNLGCGARKLDGWINVDCDVGEQPDVLCNLSWPYWPFDDNSVDEVLASHVMEHIAPGEPFFQFMRELYRVCKPGAQVKVVLPHPSHDVFVSDPTHLHAILPSTLALFSRRYMESQAANGNVLTPFCKRIGVDFDMKTFSYTFDPAVDQEDAELEWKAKHLRNIILEWSTTLVVVK